MPAGQGSRRTIRVVNLNPVAEIPVRVACAGIVRGHELGDDEVLRPELRFCQAGEQREGGQQTEKIYLAADEAGAEGATLKMQHQE
jgi:hypothetical protein